MKTQPRVFYFLSFLLLGVVVCLPLQLIYKYSLAPQDWALLIYHLSPLNWVVVGLCLVTAALCWKISPWIKVFIPLSIVGVAWNNYLVALSVGGLSALVALFSTVIFAAVFLLCFRDDAQSVLNDPAKRWWLSKPRRQLRIPTSVRTWLDDRMIGHTFDLSHSGLFLAIDDEPSTLPLRRESLKIGKLISLKLDIGPLYVLRVQAQIVRRTQASGRYPEGVGLKFVNLSDFAKRRIDDLMLQTNR